MIFLWFSYGNPHIQPFLVVAVPCFPGSDPIPNPQLQEFRGEVLASATAPRFPSDSMAEMAKKGGALCRL